MNGFLKVSFTGRNGTGAISVPGLRVGDIVVCGVNVTNTSPIVPGTSYEVVVSVDDEIQQLTVGDFSATNVVVVVLR